MSRDSLSSKSAFSSRVPSIIAFTNHPGSIHLNLSKSEENILQNYFKTQHFQESLNLKSVEPLKPLESIKKSNFTKLKENLKKKVSFKLK